MNIFIIAVSTLCIASEIVKGDYWHAITWLIVLLGAIIHIIDNRTIRELKRTNRQIRASRDAWKDSARFARVHGGRK